MGQNKINATECMLWAFLEKHYPGCSTLQCEMSSETYMFAKSTGYILNQFNILKKTALKLTITELGCLEAIFYGLE